MPVETAPGSAGVLWEEELPGGATWSHVLWRGTSLEIVDPQGGANVGAMFFNFDSPVERYNMPDTLKAQHTAKLTKGFVLYSDMGRVLCSITADTCGWHDPLSGHATPETVRQRYGVRTYQQARNHWFQNARDGFLFELAKYGLGVRDLQANVNFFSKVEASADGAITFVEGNSKAGARVALRSEMNTLVILNACQHPLDPSPRYDAKPVRLVLRDTGPAGADDACRLSRPENGRGFTLTERYFVVPAGGRR